MKHLDPIDTTTFQSTRPASLITPPSTNVNIDISITMSKLKTGFIVDSDNINSYAFDLIQRVKNDTLYFEQPILISQNLKKETEGKQKRIINLLKEHKIGYLISASLLRIIRRLELTKVRLNKKHNQYDRVYKNSDLCLETLSVSPHTSQSGFVHFSEIDLKKIESKNFDVLIRCGEGILKGDILNIAKFGVLSFHHGDNRVYRGDPSGFWEVLNREPSTGFVIQRITDGLDGGDVVFRGNIITSRYWTLNNAATPLHPLQHKRVYFEP